MANLSNQAPTPSGDYLTPERQFVAPVLGDDVARRLRTFTNGLLYVDSNAAATFFAWLIDLLVVAGASAAIAMVAARIEPGTSVAALVAVFCIAILVLPFVYGWCFRNGRALGGLITGTRVVRHKDGARIGWGKAGWVMFKRTFYLLFALMALFESTAQLDYTRVRTTIDARATKRLWATGVVWHSSAVR